MPAVSHQNLPLVTQMLAAGSNSRKGGLRMSGWRKENLVCSPLAQVILPVCVGGKVTSCNEAAENRQFCGRVQGE